MSKEPKKHEITRRQFVKQTALAAGSILMMPGSADLFPQLASAPELKAVVLGDSAMWGQGLLEKDKFAFKSIREIGKLLGRPVKVTNLSHSGAPIDSGKKQRIKFVDLYPERFGSADLRADFIDNNKQDVAVLLNQEIPSPLPDISYQVELVPASMANTAELVLLNGGANDLDFEDFLNPEIHRDDFAQHYDDLLKIVSYTKVKNLLRKAKTRFPKAVILYTGYFSPFSPNVSDSEIRTLFEHLSEESEWRIWANKNILEAKNVGQLVLEAQHRSQFGLARSLYWSRKAVVDVNKEDQEGAGPKDNRVLFIHPQFGPENTVFGSNSFFHDQYEIPKIRDAAATLRKNNIPRHDYARDMDVLLVKLYQSDLSNYPVIRKLASELSAKLNGSTTLLKALDNLAASPGKPEARMDAREALTEDLKRINHARMASFVHPNEKGAQRYANVIVKRYQERYQRVNLDNDMKKFSDPAGSNKTPELQHILNRYGLGAYNTTPANVSQLMLIDSVALEIVTSGQSGKKIYDNFFLNLGGNNRWQLNFPYREIQNVPLKILDPQLFEPGSINLFTIDAKGMHLSSITQFLIERKPGETLSSSDPWVPTKITLYLNGIEVFSVPFFSNLTRNGKLTFPYPKQ